VGNAINSAKRQMRANKPGQVTATESQIKNYRLKLGDKIRQVREQRGYSQEQLADMMDINRSTISKIENGKFSITVDYLVLFSIFLDYEFKVIER
jgi:DNA-binding XRE family transcriptional regulator